MRRYFIPYMAFETLFVLAFIYKYGFFALILEVIISLVVGFLLISRFGILDFMNEVKTITPSSVFGQFGIVFGGFLLLMPGILSDTLGIVIIIVSLIMKFLSKDNSIKDGEIYEYDSSSSTTQNFTSKRLSSDIIDAEIIDEKR